MERCRIPIVAPDLNDVAEIDHQGADHRFNEDPLVVYIDLEGTYFVMQEHGQYPSIGVMMDTQMTRYRG